MKKILFIEDDPDQIFLYQSKFDLEKLLLIAALNGQEAIDLAIKNKPDLILLDLLLRNENGLDILSKLKNNPETKNIPVIVFTNFDKNKFRDKAAELGAIDFIIKSKTTPHSLVKRIKELLGDANNLEKKSSQSRK